VVQARQKENQKHFDWGKPALALLVVLLRQMGKAKEMVIEMAKEMGMEMEKEKEKAKDYQEE
jgi:CRISPR/Cas system Type II protein with McrA/HNH and RuvC-like nuclease domain